MKSWIQYILHRFPLQQQIPLVVGLALTGAWFERGPWDLVSFVVSVTGLFLFFWLMRIQIDMRDYLQDITRSVGQKPLARTLLRQGQLKRARWMGWVVMILFAVSLLTTRFQVSGAMIFLGGFWLLMASKNYYARSFLARHPFIHSFIDHLILIPVIFFSISVFQPELLAQPEAYLLGMIFVLTMLNREIAKNLDPHSHTLLRNYRSALGVEKTWIVMFLLSIVLLIFAYRIDWFWPIFATQTFFHLLFAFLFFKPKRWDLIARASYWIFVVHAWIQPATVWLESLN